MKTTIAGIIARENRGRWSPRPCLSLTRMPLGEAAEGGRGQRGTGRGHSRREFRVRGRACDENRIYAVAISVAVGQAGVILAAVLAMLRSML